ncbi:sodium/hydrogen exchanger 9-like [Thalassophryne amazonica]|uniref:sodium/hydrogen exchanger 9-like n=1 Tax=Thalassophryne amazonica TaxID=390379 RepID=UPI00147163D4|nr:sodium/hydrogen exchanger 9-like [Thalassophryne amazonica]
MSRRHDGTLLILFVVGLALVTILSVWKLKRFKYKLVHESGGAMLFGMILGLIVRYVPFDRAEQMSNTASVCSCEGLNSTPHVLMVNISTHVHGYRHDGKIIQRPSSHSMVYMETFDPEVVFNLLLPPIIFYGAYTLNQKRLIENLGSVLTFAFLGTIITCVVIGGVVYGFTRLAVLLGHAVDAEFFFTDCLLFGAIMSATDPVSVLGLFSELHVDLDLYTLLFGESVLNDAVAIVLTHAISSYGQMGGDAFDPPAFFLSVGYFVGMLLGSIVIGFIFTIITSLLTKFSQLCENPLLETLVFFLMSWSSFLLAEASGLSGIVAVLFCGLSQARYTIHNLSSEGKTRTKQLFEIFNFLGEVFIFSYMGYVLLTFPHHAFKALFISAAFLSIFISRACSIYPLSFLLNLGRTTKIPHNFQHFMMLAGLRGGVAFSLAIRDTSTEARRSIFSTTLLLVTFTIWVLGTAADPMLHWLEVRVGVDTDENPEDCSLEVLTERTDTTLGLWQRLDYKYVKPALTHSGPPLSGSLPQWRGRLSSRLSSSHAHEDREQLGETATCDATFELEKAKNKQECIGRDTGSDPQDDLLEGDLGLGTSPALFKEASVSRSHL